MCLSIIILALDVLGVHAVGPGDHTPQYGHPTGSIEKLNDLVVLMSNPTVIMMKRSTSKLANIVLPVQKRRTIEVGILGGRGGGGGGGSTPIAAEGGSKKSSMDHTKIRMPEKDQTVWGGQTPILLQGRAHDLHHRQECAGQ